jgi:hypothetical protein
MELSTMATTNLIELLLNLLRDPSAFREDPEGFLSSCGDVSPEDIREALILLQDRQDADFSRDHHHGGNHAVHVPPPPPAPAPHPGESDHEAAIRYLDTYVTNNYVINEGDTITDNSINQQIDTHGGDFDQDIDVDSVVASGDGAVAAGGDIEDSTVTTGHHNTAGDGNIDGDDNTKIDGDDNSIVDGDHNTAGFGDGDVSSTDIGGDVEVDDGSSFAVGGSSSVDNSNYEDDDTDVDASDHSTNDSGNTSTTWHDESDNSSHASADDHSSYSDYDDSSDHSTHVDNDTTTTDSHDSAHESFSAEVV